MSTSTRRFIPTVAFALAMAVSIAPEIAAQASGTPYQRAERLVREGRGAEGRAIVDSVLRATPEDSPEYSEALYWRATLASDAADAERDYRRIMVEFPLSSRSEDALINLAQLELARGDRQRAIATLERFEREHPNSPSRARVTLWRARALFDTRNEPAACAAVATARSRVADADVELRNQIDFLAPRCVGVDTTRAVASQSTARETQAQGRGSPVSEREIPTVRPSAPTADRGAPATTQSGAARASGEGAATVARFAVQVAAYTAKEDADKLVERLAARGYQARVVGTARPFRVWVGRYATRAEADAAQQRMRSANIIGFVTEAEGAASR